MECRSAARNGITLVILVTATIFLVIDAGVVCTITELAPCTGDFASPQEPSSACCVKVKSQQTCFCQYADDPVSTVSGFCCSPEFKKIATACDVPLPKCLDSCPH
ncbi:hypothetical protein DCAR_0312166 [Daucus carota subsp. sativus]|uniref:Bifunctional inhibitor/plant lipid transfer protein/seed storage helical domain-containing protein n=1 Tax=Daucus carota subsp. sativus TaxID=79200 RepID=A0AAF0WPB3_DAUCS|nr:hypothetical protein DCAR_0312166 [Daucus carota subsp. sativus]